MGLTENQKKARSENMKKLWADPAFREKMSGVMKQQHEDPEFRRKLVEAAHSEEVNTRRKASAKKAWSGELGVSVRERQQKSSQRDLRCATCGEVFTGHAHSKRCPECRLANQLVNKWKIVAQLVSAHGTSCSICGEEVDLFAPGNTPLGASIDHVVPASRGGTNEFKNLALAHFKCNTKKGSVVL